MRLGEVKIGEVICIQAHNIFKAEEFYVTITDKDSDYLYFEPVIRDGRMVNFTISERKNHCDVNLYKGLRTFVFKDVTVSNIRNSDGTPKCHSISVNFEGGYVNTRACPRHVVQLPCAFTRGAHRGTTEAVIRDISHSGIGVVVDGYVNVGDEPTISLDFPDNYPYQTMVTQRCKVIRVVDPNVEDDDYDEYKSKKLVGMEVLNETRQYQNWVQCLEREKVKRLRGKL